MTSKPARVADEIEAADRGWVVERALFPGHRRMVRAQHPDGAVVVMEWVRINSRDVFTKGEQYADGDMVTFTNVAAKVREMTAPPAVPFDPATATDDEVINAVLRRTVEWHRELSGKAEARKVVGNPSVQRNGRYPILTFSDGSQYVSVRLDAIERVS